MDLVPAQEQFQILPEQSLVAVGGRRAQNQLEGCEYFFDGIGWPLSGHPVSLTGQAFFVALAGAFSFFLLIRSMYFCCAI